MPAFCRSEWESTMLEKRRRCKVTLRLDELDRDALEKAIEKGELMEEDEEEEGDLSDFIMVNESFSVVSELHDGVKLRCLWEQEMSSEMMPDRAYMTLEVPKEIGDLEDQPAQGDKMRKAMSVIAGARDSAHLCQFLETRTDRTYFQMPA
ncbi:hypothetical protein EW146_g5391 [Bondarzewia mesenterica]|uniref:UCH repeated domain-containing protein n=1 Tax=Bondarzewia mesenterica TaxID=1095465 RepID=A0A4S4LSQ4_9AGAM|nr:hypothetical protein EW146_g5391 [Bondarzewia mesenterica]